MEPDDFDMMQEERLWPTVEDDAEYLEPEEDMDYPPEDYAEADDSMDGDHDTGMREWGPMKTMGTSAGKISRP